MTDHQCSSPTCAMATSVLPLAAAEGMVFICPLCGSALVTGAVAAAPADPTTWPDGLDPRHMPSFLAHPWRAFVRAAGAGEHPRIALNWLVDAAELAVRWTAALLLAEVREASGGVLPDKLAAALRGYVESPTLGKWVAIVRLTTATGPAKPRFVPEAFGLWEAVVQPLFSPADKRHRDDPERSLLALRNDVAHLAGLTRAQAAGYVQHWRPDLERLLHEVVAVTRGGDVLAPTADGGVRLRGVAPTPAPLPDALARRTDAPWLVTEAGVLSLAPVTRHGPVARLDAYGQLQSVDATHRAQFYARSSRLRLDYVALDGDVHRAQAVGDELAAFRALFHLDVEGARANDRPRETVLLWDDFVNEARVDASGLIGRRDEVARLKRWVKDRDPRDPKQPRIAWIWGGPGIGKSMLLSRVASDLSHGDSARRRVFVYRFRGGDARNSQRTFLQLLRDALWSWDPLRAVTEPPNPEVTEGAKLEDDVVARFCAIEALKSPDPRAPAPDFLAVIDGLDEVVDHAPALPALLHRLAAPGSRWLLAGRPEKGLPEAFDRPTVDPPWPEGLPGLSEPDVREMLFEGLGAQRFDLLALDEDAPDGTARNPFVERAVERSRDPDTGRALPLYIHLLLEDLRAQHLAVHDAARLPDGLTAYYNDLVAREGLSDAKATLPFLVAALAVAEEPLDTDTLALLWAEDPTAGATRLERDAVTAALHAGRALLRTTHTKDATSGWSLYHHSFRQYVGRPTEGSAGQTLAGSVEKARTRLALYADLWPGLPPGNLRNHLFRHGTEYALWWQGDRGRFAARRRLTDFPYLMARLVALPANEVSDLAAEYRDVLAALPTGPDQDAFQLWESFVRERAHLLRRGDADWPANRILLQLAVEHADDSPVTLSAETWLAEGECDWTWLRQAGRPAIAVTRRELVLAGHTAGVNGVCEVPGGRLLTWGDGGEHAVRGEEDVVLRLWDLTTGTTLAEWSGHEEVVKGALVLNEDHAVSWSTDGTVRVWNLHTCEQVAVLEGDDRAVSGVVQVGHNEILAWHFAGPLVHWDLERCIEIRRFSENFGRIHGALALTDRRAVRWCGTRIRLWDLDTGKRCFTLRGRFGTVESLSPEHLLSYRWDGYLELFDSTTGDCVWEVQGVSKVRGIRVVDRTLVSWSDSGTIELRSLETGDLEMAIEAHPRFGVSGVIPLDDGRLLSWSRWASDGALAVWSRNGQAEGTMKGHRSAVVGATCVADGSVISWAEDGTLAVWDVARAGQEPVTIEGHRESVIGARQIGDRLISWGADCLVNVYPWPITHSHKKIVSAVPDDGHQQPVRGVAPLPGGGFLTWSLDGTMRGWNPDTGAVEWVAVGHEGQVNQALVLGDLIVSCSADASLRVWNSRDGTLLRVLRGHSAWVRGLLALSPERILSWSGDKTLRTWNITTGESDAPLVGHGDWVVAARRLAGGQLLSWDAKGGVIVWSDSDGSSSKWPRRRNERVNGVLETKDGGLLVWSESQWRWYLRLCARNGEVRVRFEQSVDVVGAVEIPQGYLTWGTRSAVQWDAEGTVVQTWPIKRLMSESFEVWRHVRAAEGTAGPKVAVARRSGVGIAAAFGGSPVIAQWHSTGDWTPGSPLDSGALSARCGARFAVLHVYRGNQRRSSVEAASIDPSE